VAERADLDTMLHLAGAVGHCGRHRGQRITSIRHEPVVVTSKPVELPPSPVKRPDALVRIGGHDHNVLRAQRPHFEVIRRPIAADSDGGWTRRVLRQPHDAVARASEHDAGGGRRAAFGGLFWLPAFRFGTSFAAGCRAAAFGRVARLLVGGRVLGLIVVGLATLLGRFWP
jgi:hypothetical protein